jgi:hypothetical protein
MKDEAGMPRDHGSRRAFFPALLAYLDVPALAGIFGLYLLSRAALAIIALLALHTLGAEHQRFGNSLIQMWCRWDCGWYLRIAADGYTTASVPEQPGATTLAFFPLFPLLMRAVSGTTGAGLVVSGIVVANLSFLAALVYIHRYILLLGLSRTTAILTIALLCFVPQGFVFSAVYTESLFLLLLSAAMYHTRRGQFLHAGLAAALLSAVRANGVFFLVFALAWIIREYGPRLLFTPWRRPEVFVPVLLAPMGLFAFWTFSFYLSGDAFAQASSIAHGWGWRSGFFVDNLRVHLAYDAASRFLAIASLMVFMCSLLLLRLRLYEELLLCVAMMLLLWTGQIPNSLLRYSIVLFPAWIALAWHLDARPVTSAAVFATFSLVNGFLMTAWTLEKLIAI